MYKDLIGKDVTIVVSSRGDNLLEYTGKLTREDSDTLELENVRITYLTLNFQKGLFGNSMYTYKDNLEKTIISKRYIISCDKERD